MVIVCGARSPTFEEPCDTAELARPATMTIKTKLTMKSVDAVYRSD